MSQYFAALFSRRPNEGWFRVSRYDITTVDIMTGLSLLSIFIWAASPTGLWNRLIFSAPEVRGGQVWRLVTWPVAEGFPDGRSFLVVIGIVFWWSFGQQIEALMGRGKFLIWVLAVAIVPAVTVSLLGLVSNSFDLTSFTFGLGPVFLSAIWVYAATYPNVRMLDIIPLWAVAAVFTLIQFLQLTGFRASGAILFLLVAIVTALSVGRTLGFATAWPIPHIPIGAGVGSGGGRKKRSKPSPPKRPKRGGAGQRVVEGPWRREPESSTPRIVPPTGPTPADQEEMDGLLDKISDHGMDSLSGEEKQRLNELSKRLRNR